MDSDVWSHTNTTRNCCGSVTTCLHVHDRCHDSLHLNMMFCDNHLTRTRNCQSAVYLHVHDRCYSIMFLSRNICVAMMPRSPVPQLVLCITSGCGIETLFAGTKWIKTWNKILNKASPIWSSSILAFANITLLFVQQVSTTSNECVECNSFQSDIVLVVVLWI